MMPWMAGFALAAVISSFALGHHLTAKYYRAEITSIRMEAKRQEAVYHGIAEQLQEEISKLEKAANDRGREVTRIIKRPVYRNVCLDDDGLRLTNDALTNTAGKTP